MVSGRRRGSKEGFVLILRWGGSSRESPDDTEERDGLTKYSPGLINKKMKSHCTKDCNPVDGAGAVSRKSNIRQPNRCPLWPCLGSSV